MQHHFILFCDVTVRPEKVHILPSTAAAALKDGDWLACSTEGSQSPIYNWTDVSTGRIIHQGMISSDILDMIALLNESLYRLNIDFRVD